MQGKAVFNCSIYIYSSQLQLKIDMHSLSISAIAYGNFQVYEHSQTVKGGQHAHKICRFISRFACSPVGWALKLKSAYSDAVQKINKYQYA